MTAIADHHSSRGQAGPSYAWRKVVHPYSAVLLCGMLIMVPYFFDSSVSFLFKSFVRFADPYQHLVISSSIIFTMAAGVFFGLLLMPPASRETVARRVHFYRSDIALLVFGGLLAVSLLMALVKSASGFASLGTSVYAARSSIRNLGGTAVLGDLYIIAVPSALLVLRLRGLPIAAVASATFAIIAISAVAVSERLAIIKVVLSLLIFVGLFQPQIIRVRTVAAIGLICVTLFGINMVMRAEAMLPPALKEKVVTLLPDIVGSTLGAYYSDPANKLYYQMLVPYRGGSLGNELFFMTAAKRIAARLNGEPIGVGESSSKYSATAGQFTDLDALGGRDIKLTNPGGPSQDFSDFGWWMYAVIFIKFLVFAMTYRAAASMHPLALTLYPMLLISAWDYPRLNIPYEVGGFVPLLLGVIVVLPAMYFERAQARQQAGAMRLEAAG
jgi:hypothetical protein